MNSDSDATLEALAHLRREKAPAEEPIRAVERRARLLPRLIRFSVDARERVERRRSWRRRAAILAVAAAPALAFTGWLAAHQTKAPTAATNTARSSTDTAPLAADDKVRTGVSGQALVTLASGATVEIGARTELRFEPAGAREELIRLDLGRIDLKVPPLREGASLAVRTPHAKVVVHGTRFSVDVHRVAGSPGLVTTVEVMEGRVGVDNGGGPMILLAAGSRWSSVPESGDIGRREAAAKSQRSRLSGAAPGSTAIQSSSSTLAEENRLFRAALEARRNGDPARAVELLDALLTRYRGSPLAGEARAQRAGAAAEAAARPF